MYDVMLLHDVTLGQSVHCLPIGPCVYVSLPYNSVLLDAPLPIDSIS